LLDLGCGGGSFLQVFKKLGVEAARIEPSSSAAAARECGIDVFTGTVEEYIAKNSSDKKFDVVLCSHVLGATPFPVETLDGMRQLLAPNGYIWVGVPNTDSEYARKLGWRWHSTYFPRNLIQFTPETLSKAGEVAGRGNSATVHLFCPRSCGLFALFAVAPSLVHTAQNF
jgi:2-polyprenyl-3-methyl-5-hydroxy-6-metoxy-1,4-benzoquinol methylase